MRPSVPSFVLHALFGALSLSALASCATAGKNAWPQAPQERPVPAALPDSQVRFKIEELRAGSEKAGLGALDGRGETSLSSPVLYFWRSEPADWHPVKNSLGSVTGRRSGNAPLVSVSRLNGKFGRTIFEGAAEDLCVWKALNVEQMSVDNSGERFDEHVAITPGDLDAGRIDCTRFEELKSGAH